MMTPYVISIDLGTTNAKVAIVDQDGELITTATGSIPLIHVDDDGVEIDPEVVWNLIKNLVGQLVRDSGVSSSQIIGIIAGAHYASIVPVDSDGQPTMNMVVHLDQRSTLARLKRLPGFKPDNSWQQLRWLRRSGMPPLSSGLDSLTTMRMIKYAFPEVYRRTKTFLEPVDFLSMRFSGRHTASQCTALVMLGIDNNRHGRIDYDPDLIRASQIEADKWPELVSVNSVVGTILPVLADELGLSRSTKIFSGLTDTQASGVGCGAFTGTHCAIGIGTTGVMITHVDRRRTDLRRGMLSMPAPVADKFFVLGEGGLTGKVIEHFLTHLVYPNDSFADHSSDEAFAALDQVLASVPPGSNGVLFLPWLAGMLPKSEPAMRGGVMNISLETTRADLARAAVEGLVLHLHWLGQSVQTFAKRQFSHFVFYGGGAKSRAISQIMADVSQIPVHQTEEPEYIGVRGAAYLAFAQQGLMAIDDIPDKLKVCEIHQPQPEFKEIYQRRFRDLQIAFKQNRLLFKRMNLR